MRPRHLKSFRFLTWWQSLSLKKLDKRLMSALCTYHRYSIAHINWTAWHRNICMHHASKIANWILILEVVLRKIILYCVWWWVHGRNSLYLQGLYLMLSYYCMTFFNIFQAIRDILLKGHREAFLWIDEWHGKMSNCTNPSWTPSGCACTLTNTNINTITHSSVLTMVNLLSTCI